MQLKTVRFALFLLIFLTLPLRATAQVVSIPDPNLRASIEDALDKAAGAPISQAEMATLIELYAPNADITDLTGLETATNLERLYLGTAYVPSEGRFINSNAIANLTPLSGLPRLTRLHLEGNEIRDISPLGGLTSLVVLGLGNNVISDITALKGLINLFFIGLWDNQISDISPLVLNTGFGQGEEINVSENPLNDVSVEIHIPALQGRGVEIHFSNLKPVLEEYLLSLPAGLSLIHIPLKVVTVDGLAKPILTIGDLYDALGGSIVNFIVTYDPAAQTWFAYFGDAERGSLSDRTVTADMGVIVNMSVPITIRFNGNPLLMGENERSVALYAGLNLLGLPVRDSRINRVSDLLSLDGILDNAHSIIVADGAQFKLVARAGDLGDIEIRKGQAFIVIVQRSATVSIISE